MDWQAELERRRVEQGRVADRVERPEPKSSKKRRNRKTPDQQNGHSGGGPARGRPRIREIDLGGHPLLTSVVEHGRLGRCECADLSEGGFQECEACMRGVFLTRRPRVRGEVCAPAYRARNDSKTHKQPASQPTIQPKRQTNKQTHTHTHSHTRTLDGGCPASAAASHHSTLRDWAAALVGNEVLNFTTSRASYRSCRVITHPSRERSPTLHCEGRSLDGGMATPSTSRCSLWFKEEITLTCALHRKRQQQLEEICMGWSQTGRRAELCIAACVCRLALHRLPNTHKYTANTTNDDQNNPNNSNIQNNRTPPTPPTTRATHATHTTTTEPNITITNKHTSTHTRGHLGSRLGAAGLDLEPNGDTSSGSNDSCTRVGGSQKRTRRQCEREC